MSLEAPSYTGLELDVMRGIFALAVLHTLTSLRLFPAQGAQSQPVGVARWISLRWLGKRRKAVHLAGEAAVIALVLDRGAPWALLVITAVLILEVTAASSDGAVNHGHHLVTVVALVQLLAMALWGVADRRDLDLGYLVAETRDATAAWWAVQAVVAVYLTSGITKIVASGGAWIHQSPMLLAAARARRDMAPAPLQGSDGDSTDRTQRVVDVLLGHPRITRLLFGAGLLVELAAPVGLLGENALLAVGLGLILLHRANGFVLGLPFPTYQLVVLAYMVNVPRLFV